MEEIYIGAKYERGLSGSLLDGTPHVFLFSQSRKKYYEAEVIARQNGSGYDFLLSETVTQKMHPGFYTLEVYNTNNDTLLRRYPDYAKAIIVTKSSSQGSENGNSN